MFKRRKLLSVILALCMVLGSYSKAPVVYAAGAEETAAVETAAEVETALETIAETIAESLEEVTTAGVTDYVDPTEEQTEAPALSEDKEETTQAPETQAPVETETGHDAVEETVEPGSEEAEPAVDETEDVTEPEVPEDPETEAPEDPETEAPEDPETEAPEDPETEAPEDPETQAPEDPETEAPEEPEQPEVPQVVYSKALQEVIVSVTVNADAFDEDVVLVVKPLENTSEEYQDAAEKLADDGQEFDGMLAYDIGFQSVATGEPVEPNSAVAVKLTLCRKALEDIDAAAVDTDSVTVSHITEDAVEVVADVADETDGQVTVNADETAMKSVKAEFEVDGFSTFTITWRGGDRTVTVHYVDTAGNELNIANPDNTHPNLNAQSASPAFLIYDIDGYTYDHTYRNNDSNRIAPLLTKNGQNRWQYMGANNTTTNELSNNDNIYVVYRKNNAITPGGTAVIEDVSGWPGEHEPGAPEFSKSSVNNGDGTNTVSLEITATEKPVEQSTPADVIVVFDISGSMAYNMSGSQTQNVPTAQQRITLAKNAINTMADTLLDNRGVRMALITFSTDAQVVQSFTNNYTTFSNRVNAQTPGGGTNWEKALKLANEMQVRSDAATYVVFVTDGDPTFRVSRGDVTNQTLNGDTYNANTAYQYYRNNAVFGQGNDDSNGYNFDFAVDQVEAIDGANKNFYAVGISNDVTKVQNLTTEGGVDADHAFIASNNAAMEAAFKSITESIKSDLGFGDVEITDGITELSHTEMKVMETVDPNSFKYYRYGGAYGGDAEHMTEWTTRAADGCGAASYDEDDGAVHWNMGEGFQLEDGVHYVVTFRVWPSQEAYDLVADLNNGIKTYDGLSAEEKAQIVELDTNPVTYALKTNTDTVNATYSQTTKTGDKVTVSGEQDLEATYRPGKMENMDLTSMLLTVKKEFEDDLTGGEDRETEVTLILQRRNAHQDPEPAFAVYNGPGMEDGKIVLNEGNNWTYELYVAPGFEVDGEVLEHGYDFTITEPGIDYHYGLIEEIINPMVVDGKDTYYGDGYLIDDEETISEYTDKALTAVDRVKSGIDVKKLVFDVDGTTEIHPDTTFTITGKILDADGNPFTWAEGDNVNNSGAYHKYTPFLDENGKYMEPDQVEEYDPNSGNYFLDENNHVYKREVYKGHFDSTANITLELKAGEFVRFINVPDGCTFEFTESSTMPEGYAFDSIEAKTQHRTSAGGAFTTEGDVQPETSGQTAKLETGVVGNKQYSITYGNKRTAEVPTIELVKVDANDPDIKLNGVEFELYKEESMETLIPRDAVGAVIDIETGNKEGSDGPDGWAEIGKLEPGTYYLHEVAAPDGYLARENDPIPVTVAINGETVTVTSTDDTVTITEENGVFTITVENEKATTNVTVVKEWEDADDQDGKRPDSISVQLLAGETPVGAAVTLEENEDHVWTYTWEDVDIYDADGEAIEYTVKEADIEGYTAEDPVVTGDKDEGFTVTITNVHEPEETEVKATKEWDDNDNQDGKRAAVTFDLYADGVKQDGKSQTIAADATGDALTVTWSELPVYADGKEIKYTVQEAGVTDGKITMNGAEYTVTVSGNAEEGFKIKNSYTPEETEIKATKEWDDNNNQDGKRAAVTFDLYADGVKQDGKSQTIAADATGDALTVTWSELPVYADGKEIKYTVQEAGVTDGKITMNGAEYTVTVSGDAEEGFTIKNSYTPEETEVKATKEWDDAENQDGKRDAVTFDLYADGVKQDGKSQTIAADATGDALTVTWSELPVYANGKEIKYTVQEAGVTDGKITMNGAEYTVTVSGDAENGFTIKNSYTPEETEIKATKEWDDNNNQDGKRAAVTFVLKADGEAIAEGAEKTIAADATGDALTVTWTGLPVYKAGTAIVYTVEEKDVTDGKITMNGAEYTVTVSGDAEEGFTIKNSYTPEETEVKATKEWDDAENQDGKRDAVTFDLYADGVKQDGKSQTIAKDATGEALTVTWSELPVYANGKEIKYTVQEAGVTDGKITMNGAEYTVTVSGDAENGFTIKNSYTPEETEVKATKEWDDNDNQDGKRDAVTFVLKADGEAIAEGAEKTIAADATGDALTVTWTGLPVYKAGTAIVYTVEEKGVENGKITMNGAEYTVTVTGDAEEGFTIKNSHTPEQTEIEVIKEWEDFDTAALRPEKITVTLSGKVDGKEVYTATKDLTASTWTATFEDLDVYYEGSEIEYSVTEAAVANYGEPTYGELTETDTGYTITITNPHETGDLKVTKTVISPAESDHEKAFEIKITLSPAVAGEFEAEGTDAATVTFNSSGEATVNLKDGETLTIKGLPTTVEATVTETNPGSQYKAPVLDPAAGKVTIGEEAAEVEITNERKVGDLKLTKTVVSSTNADHQKAFNFNITLTGEEGATVNGDFAATGVEGIETVTFTNGAAAAALKDGQTLTIKGLPVGVSYEVTEEEADQGGFVTTKSDDTGDIKESAPADVKFTNTRSEGSLVVAKKVVSKLPADVDPEQTKFTITITLDDTTINNTYSGVEFVNGVATVELGHGESVIIEGLPADMGYTISEEAPENFEEPEIDGAEGTIAKDDTKKAEVTNTRKTGDLTITKTVESVFAADKEKTFEFTITLDPAFEATFDTVDGEGTEGTITFDEKGVATVTLKDGEEITIKGLPVTVSYTVEETEDPEFKTTQTGDSGEITAAAAAETEGEPETEGETEGEGTKAEFTNERKLVKVSVEKVWEDEDNKYEKQPESITVVLLADKKPYKDEEGNEVTAELNADNEWKYTFENLPEVVGKKTVEYTVDEVMEDENGEPLFPGYTKEITGSAEKGFTITNTFKPVDTDPPVGKVVIGDKPADPETFKFTFKATSSDPEPPMPEQTEIEIVGEGMEEFGQFWFTEPGTYEYEIAEVKEDAEGYTYDSTVYKLKYEITVGKNNELVKKMFVNGKEVKEFEQDTIQFENKYTMPKVKITVNKTWEDNDDEWSIRPASIKVEVKGNGEVVKTVLLTEMDGWTKTIKGLPKYDEDGEEIKYTINEFQVSGYKKAEIGELTEEEDGVFTIELTNVMKDFEKVDKVITVKKNVENGPKKVSTYKFELEAVGDAPVPEGVKNGTFTIKGDGSTQLKFSFDEPGTYTYKLKEVNTGEKDCTYDKAEYKLVFKVTLNTKTSKLEAKLAITNGKKTVEGTKVTFTNSYLVKTGDDTNMTPWVVAMATSATIAGTGVVVIKKRRKEEEDA